MKKTDVATIVTIALLSMGAAYFLAVTVIGRSTTSSVKVKTVDSISANVDQPDSSVFNSDAINPTVEVIIGDK